MEPGGADGKKRPQSTPAGLVRIGREKGDFISIESGSRSRRNIVSSGQFKLRSGMAVVEQNRYHAQLGGKSETFR